MSDIVDTVVQDALDSFNQKASGWFSKPQDKIEYDAVRQQVWDAFASIVNRIDALRPSGGLTRVILQQAINSVEKLRSDFAAYTSRVRDGIGASWVDPRFHDYYDFMGKVVSQWNTEIATMPYSVTDAITSWLTPSATSPVQFPSPTSVGPALPGPAPYLYPQTSILPAGSNTTLMLIVGAALVGMFLFPARHTRA